MQSRWLSVWMLSMASVVALGGCNNVSESEETTHAEALPEIVPDLPEVPTLPPPPHPITYEDESYSVYGLRNRMRHMLDNDVTLTGYIVDIFDPPPCKAKKKDDCPATAAPHLWIADTADENARENEMIVVGYADNHDQLARARSGRKVTTIDGTRVVPGDLAVGQKIRTRGRYTLISAGGFNSSNGLLEYTSHEKLD